MAEKVATSIGGKVLLVLFGMILLFVGLEIGLRVAGYVYVRCNRLQQGSHPGHKIFCVGESTTFGVGAEDEARDNYPRQLEELLNSKFPGLNTKCFFDSNIGLNTSMVLVNFSSSLRNYNPDIVIIMAGINNWWNLNKSNALLFTKNNTVRRVSFQVLDFLDQFRVFKLLKWICYSNKFILFEGNSNVPADFKAEKVVSGTKEDQEMGRVIQYFDQTYDCAVFDKIAERDIRQMIKMCLDNNIKVIICGYPRKPARDLAVIQRKLAQEFGVSFVDNEVVFDNLPERQKYLSSDKVHPNRLGYGIVAQNIFNMILKDGLIERRKDRDK